MQNNSTLQKPSLVSTLIAASITIFRDTFAFSTPTLPTKIADYILVTDLKKTREYSSSFGLGVYEKKEKKFFIKYWSGPLKDLNYYSLTNECLITEFLQNK